MTARPSLVVLALACLFGAACSNQEPAGGKVHLRYLAAPDVGRFSKAVIADFEKTHPGIVVEMVEGPAASDARENMYATSFMAKEDTYDLAYIDVAWLPKFAAQGWLAPLDERLPAAKRRDFLDGDLAGATYKGKLYSLPIQSDGGVLYYRKDLLAEKGFKPPKTWSELVREAKALQTPERAGFVFQGKQYEGLACAFLEVLWGFGGDLVDADDRVHLDEPPAVAALTALVGAIRTDKISPPSVLTYQEEEARNVFQEGRAVFMRNWPYAWNLMQAQSSPVRGKVGMIPMVAGPGGTSAATLGGWGFGLSAYSRHPDEAWQLAEFFSSAQSQKTAFLLGGILPSRKSLFKDPQLLKVSPQLKELGTVLAHTRSRPANPQWARISDSLQLHVSAALSGQEEPAQAMKDAAAEIRQAVEFSKR